MKILTDEEEAFVAAVFHYPGSKYPVVDHSNIDGSAVWRKPEDLGLVECVGSYKWKPVEGKFKIRIEILEQWDEEEDVMVISND